MSLSSLPISPAKLADLQKRMAKLNILEEDLEEEFIKGSGPGGQKINKTSVVVLLTHKVSGIQIRCQETRSQSLNRYYARKLLVEKLEQKVWGEKSKKQQEIAKIKRQKRKRSKRAKEKVLEAKKKNSLKKELRRKPELSS